MREARGDWKDLLSVYRLALDFRKIYLGFIALLTMLLLMIVTAMLYHAVGGPIPGVRELGMPNRPTFLPMWLFCGKGLAMLERFSPLLNPLAGDYRHFLVSVVFYLMGLLIVARCCGPITRLAALEYARDDVPSLREAERYYGRKWLAYWFAPLTPVIGVIVLMLPALLGGLVALLVPFVGGWILLFANIIIIPCTVLAAVAALATVATFGLMFPCISVEGQDAFDGWNRAFVYLKDSIGRFVGYAALAAVLGVASLAVAWVVAETAILGTVRTVGVTIGPREAWLQYHWRYPDCDGILQRVGALPTEQISYPEMVRRIAGTTPGGGGDAVPIELADVSYQPCPLQPGMWRVIHLGRTAPMNYGPIIMPRSGTDPSIGGMAASYVAYVLLVSLRGLVVAFAISYFFTAWTVIFFLLRKVNDGVDVTDIYDEQEPEEPAQQEAPQPAAPAQTEGSSAVAAPAGQESPAGAGGQAPAAAAPTSGPGRARRRTMGRKKAPRRKPPQS